MTNKSPSTEERVMRVSPELCLATQCWAHNDVTQYQAETKVLYTQDGESRLLLASGRDHALMRQKQHFDNLRAYLDATTKLLKFL